MTGWERYWTTYPKTLSKKDYMKQVQKVFRGHPIPEWKFKIIVSEICHRLKLEEEDILLDLCCGNGLITKELAKKFRE